MPTELIHIPATEGEPSMTDEPADVHIHRTWAHPKFGLKLGIDLAAPPWEGGDEDAFEQCKADFKELEFSRFHATWNKAGEEWEADFKRLNAIIDHMTDEGWDVTVDLEVAKEFEAEGYTFLPDHRDPAPSTDDADADDESHPGQEAAAAEQAAADEADLAEMDAEIVAEEQAVDANLAADDEDEEDEQTGDDPICTRCGTDAGVRVLETRELAVAHVTRLECVDCGSTGTRREWVAPGAPRGDDYEGEIHPPR